LKSKTVQVKVKVTFQSFVLSSKRYYQILQRSTFLFI